MTVRVVQSVTPPRWVGLITSCFSGIGNIVLLLALAEEVILSVCLSVCLCLLRLHYAPLQWYMGYLCTIRAQYATPRRNMHHGAQGRLYFLKNSGDPDDFLFWWLFLPSCLLYFTSLQCIGRWAHFNVKLHFLIFQFPCERSRNNMSTSLELFVTNHFHSK